MTGHKKQYEKGILWAITAYAAFSISDGLRKIQAQDYAVIDILFWQGFMGLVILCGLALARGGCKSLLAPKRIKWHVVRGILIALNTTFSLLAISKVPMMDAYTIFFLTPFVTSILGVVFFGEKIGKYRFMAIFLGFVGAFIAFRPGFAMLDPAYLYACVCVFTFSFSSIIARHVGAGHGNLAYGFWPQACLVVGILLMRGGAIPPAHNFIFFVSCTAIGIAYITALILISRSYALAPIAIVAQYQYVQLIFALAFGYYVFRDHPDGYKIFGALVIVGSGVLLFARERRARRGI